MYTDMIRTIKRYLTLTAWASFLLNGTSLAQLFYPLQIGNRWDYAVYEGIAPRTFSHYQSIRVIGTLTPSNGMTYYQLSYPDLPGGNLVRVDSNKVYYYNEDKSREEFLYKLNAEYNEMWPTDFSATQTKTVRLAFIKDDSLFGAAVKQLFLTHTAPLNYAVTLSDKFGPMIYETDGEPSGVNARFIRLIGCVIADTVYGNLVVNVQHPPPVPTVFELYQNYPNPFNGNTAIWFSLSQTSSVQLSIFNTLGELLSRYDLGTLPTGNHQVLWTPNSTSSGIYLYQLTDGATSRTRKMLFTK